MDKIKKDYLVEKYKNRLNDKDLKKFEEGLEQSSEHALSDVIDTDMQLKSVTITVLLSIFFGGFGAARFYLGDKKLGFLRLGINTGMWIIAAIFNNIATRVLSTESLNAVTALLIVSVVFAVIDNVGLIIWAVTDLILCILRAKKLNKDMLLSAAYAQPGPDTEKSRTYHGNTLKTMSVYDKFKKQMHKRDNERYKTAFYYATDEAFEPLEKIELKSRLIAVPLSIFFGLFCVGSFYLENNKRAIRWLIVNLVLIFCGILLTGLAFFFFNDFMITHYEAWSQNLGNAIASICAGIAIIIFIVLIVRYFKEISDVYDQVKVINGKKIIDTLSNYSINKTAH